jgi:hypothetical protein
MKLHIIIIFTLMACSSEATTPTTTDASVSEAGCEKCAPRCDGPGPICCGPEGPSEPGCVGQNAWQCGIGTIAQSRDKACLTPDAAADTIADVGGCAASATTEACITCCKQPDAPNYGGFELYANDVCTACTACKDLSPCGTNVTPPAGKTCVSCLQMKIAATLPTMCASNAKCKAFAECLATCPLK